MFCIEKRKLEKNGEEIKNDKKMEKKSLRPKHLINFFYKKA